MRVLVLNGPNLNLLGTREPEVYGSTTLPDLENLVRRWAADLDVEVEMLQSNHEGDLVEAIQQATRFDGLVINPGALTHTSRAIGDALAAVDTPAVEVHISNLRRREPWRAVSYLADYCLYSIMGRGIDGYRHALRLLVNRTTLPSTPVRYGPHPDHVADLRLPHSSPVGLVVLVHGGFWLDEWTRDTMDTLAVDLTRGGFATLNTEYRRLGTGAAWPAPVHDLGMVLDLTSLRPQLTGLRTALVGHSAGGHTALGVARRRRGRAVDLVVGLAAVTDLDWLAASAGPGAEPAAALLASGAPPRLPADPDRTLLVHGEADRLVPPAHSLRLEGSARVEVLPGLDHFQLLDPAQAHWGLVKARLDRAST